MTAIAAVSLMAASRPGHSATYSFKNFDGPDAQTTIATGISNTGAVAGYELVASTGQIDAFIINADGSSTIFAVPGADATAAFGINSSGQVSGYYQYDSNKVGAFLRSADGTITLINDPTAVGTYALGINDLGQVVQASVQASNQVRYFRRNPDGSTTTLSVPGLAYAINNSGTLAGYYFGGTYASGYVTNPDGSYTPIIDPAAQGSETQAVGVNDFGLVSGSYVDDSQSKHFAFVRGLDGSFTNFADPDATGSTFGLGINNAGQVAGYYLASGGQYRGFIATPITDVSEPSAASILGMGIVGLLLIGGARRKGSAAT